MSAVSPLGAVRNHLPSCTRLERRRVGERSLRRFSPLALLSGDTAVFSYTRERRCILRPCKDMRYSQASALTESFEPDEQAFESFMMFQQHGHGNDFEGPWTRQIHPSLDVEFGAVEETIKGRLIVLT